MKRETDFYTLIARVLRYGVIISCGVILLGSILLFAEGQTGYYALGTAEQLVDRHNHFLIGIVPLIQGVASLKPYAVIDFGVVLLLATPVARVLTSVFLFVQERRYLFVLITSFVLALLLFSIFVLGPALG
jgi:uncharacterized membrane protein